MYGQRPGPVSRKSRPTNIRDTMPSWLEDEEPTVTGKTDAIKTMVRKVSGEWALAVEVAKRLREKLELENKPAKIG